MVRSHHPHTQRLVLRRLAAELPLLSEVEEVELEEEPDDEGFVTPLLVLVLVAGGRVVRAVAVERRSGCVRWVQARSACTCWRRNCVARSTSDSGSSTELMSC